MSFPYYRFYPGDYLRDTIHLGWLEDCAYRRLIDLYALHSKAIPNDRSYILRAVRATEPEQQAAVDTVLAEFFTLKGAAWHQSKCDSELDYRDSISKNGKTAARERWAKKQALAALQHANALPTQSEGNANQNQNQNKATTLEQNAKAFARESFELFWTTYPRKKNKGQAERAWMKLKLEPDLFGVIMGALRIASSSQDWAREAGRYIPYPATWVNARGWQDEQQSAPPKQFVI